MQMVGIITGPLKGLLVQKHHLQLKFRLVNALFKLLGLRLTHMGEVSEEDLSPLFNHQVVLGQVLSEKQPHWIVVNEALHHLQNFRS